MGCAPGLPPVICGLFSLEFVDEYEDAFQMTRNGTLKCDKASLIRMATFCNNPTKRFLCELVVAVPLDVVIFEDPGYQGDIGTTNRNKALVAVSVGLLENMNADEVEAVLGHEIGHVANGDMITLSLIQGVVNTFVLFLARLAGFFVDRVVLKNERGLGIGYWVTTIVAEIV